MATSRLEVDEANRRMSEIRSEGTIIAARYDRTVGRIVLSLSLGYEISFTPDYCQETEFAFPEDLEEAEITPAGLAVHFPRIDADIYLPSLLKGITGTKAWMKAHGRNIMNSGGPSTLKHNSMVSP